jgi:hypothetical protein
MEYAVLYAVMVIAVVPWLLKVFGLLHDLRNIRIVNLVCPGWKGRK